MGYSSYSIEEELAAYCHWCGCTFSRFHTIFTISNYLHLRRRKHLLHERQPLQLLRQLSCSLRCLPSFRVPKHSFVHYPRIFPATQHRRFNESIVVNIGSKLSEIMFRIVRPAIINDTEISEFIFCNLNFRVNFISST